MRDGYDFVEIFVTGLFIITIILFCAFGYSEYDNYKNKIDAGTVIEKSHTEGYWFWQSTGKTGFMQYIPPTWGLTITDGKKKYHFGVDEYYFNQVHRGQYITIGE